MLTQSTIGAFHSTDEPSQTAGGGKGGRRNKRNHINKQTKKKQENLKHSIALCDDKVMKKVTMKSKSTHHEEKRKKHEAKRECLHQHTPKG